MDTSKFLIGLFSFTLLLGSCSSDDNTIIDDNTPTDPTNEIAIGSVGGIVKLSGITNWTSDKIYTIGGKIVVTEGATLNIAAGTLIKALPGTGNDATAIVVARGGTINAVGTATAPIIMTDANDQITLEDVAAGNFVSPNRLATDRGRWGGLVLLGKGTISDSSPEAAIEGIVAAGDDNWNMYGGDDDSDSSGRISYLSIRHTGTQVTPDSELQGLTLGGVGSGTTIDHIESYASNDDGLEIFGGSAILNHIVVYAHGDDGLDTDFGWNGTINNAVIELAADSDTAFEYDGPRNPNDDAGNQNVTQNITIFARYTETSGNDQGGQFKENSNSIVKNVLLTGSAANLAVQSEMEDFIRNNGNYKSFTTARTFGTDPLGSENLIFSDWYYNGNYSQATIVGNNVVLSDDTLDINSSFSSWATIGTTPDQDQGADLSEFTGWSVWSAQADN
ncbi:MAG: hypothetical protein ACPIA1_06915 [Flavobacteriaceae bacterium]